MAEIQLRKSSDGRLLARRTDGMPLTPEDRANARRLIGLHTTLASRTCVAIDVRGIDGKLRAIQICSAAPEGCLWVVFDRSFEPRDDLAIYYREEIPFLRTKTLEQLREIHKVKLIFPRCRVIQEGPETKGGAI